MALRNVAPFSTRKAGSWPSVWSPEPRSPLGLKVLQPPSYVPLVTRMVEVIDWLPVDVQVAPVMLPPPLLLLLLDEELVELELLLDVELLLELDAVPP